MNLYRCGICGAIVKERERTPHLLDWTIPKHKEWFVAPGGAVWRDNVTKQVYYSDRYSYENRWGKITEVRVTKGKPHITPGSSVSEYFDKV